MLYCEFFVFSLKAVIIFSHRISSNLSSPDTCIVLHYIYFEKSSKYLVCYRDWDQLFLPPKKIALCSHDYAFFSFWIRPTITRLIRHQCPCVLTSSSDCIMCPLLYKSYLAIGCLPVIEVQEKTLIWIIEQGYKLN